MEVKVSRKMSIELLNMPSTLYLVLNAETQIHRVWIPAFAGKTCG
jgi:hypothetical protein